MVWDPLRIRYVYRVLRAISVAGVRTLGRALPPQPAQLGRLSMRLCFIPRCNIFEMVYCDFKHHNLASFALLSRRSAQSPSLVCCAGHVASFSKFTVGRDQCATRLAVTWRRRPCDHPATRSRVCEPADFPTGSREYATQQVA